MKSSSAPYRKKMLEYTVTPLRSLDGMPLARGANAHAGTGYRDPSMLQAADGQGVCARLDWERGDLFSWDMAQTRRP
jgi:hypothetical protein